MIALNPASHASFTGLPFAAEDLLSTHAVEMYRLDGLTIDLVSAGMRQKRIDRYELIWIKSGDGHFNVNGQEIAAFDKFIYCFTPGQDYKFFPGDNTLTGYLISFPPAMMGDTSDPAHRFDWMIGCKGLYKESVPDSRETKWELEIICRKMLQQVSATTPGTLNMFKALLNLLLTYFNRLEISEESARVSYREYHIYKRFKLMIKASVHSRKKVCEYAEELQVTGNYLNKSVKSISGYSASHHIQQQIIDEAKRQAIQGGLSLKEIAYGLGFDSLAHFSKFFKNYSGENFSSFKRAGGCIA